MSEQVSGEMHITSPNTSTKWTELIFRKPHFPGPVTARNTHAENINWIHTDIKEFDVASRKYDLILVSFFPELEVIQSLKDGLTTDGVLLFEHHLRTTDEIDRGPTEDGLESNPDRYRDRSQELLHTCLGLTILYYEEGLRTYEDGGQAAVASVVARNSTGGTQSYPESRMGRD